MIFITVAAFLWGSAVCVVVTISATTSAGHRRLAIVLMMPKTLALEASQWIRDVRIHLDVQVASLDALRQNCTAESDDKCVGFLFFSITVDENSSHRDDPLVCKFSAETLITFVLKVSASNYAAFRVQSFMCLDFYRDVHKCFRF